MLKKTVFLLVGSAILFQFAHSQDDGMDFKTTGYFLFDMGYLNRGIDENGEAYESFTHGAIGAGIVLTAQPSDFLSLRINPEIKSYHPFPREQLGLALEQRARWDVYVDEARADFRFGDEERPSFYAGIGRLLYAENPDARIFGNYLFRSMIYPGILFTSFNNPKAQILGLQLGNNLGEGFNHNLFLTTSFDYYPYYDMSLSYEASFSFGDLFSVGGGIGLRNLVPMRPSLTSPVHWDGTRSNVIFDVAPDQTMVLPALGDTLKIGAAYKLKPGEYALDSGATPGMVVTPVTVVDAAGTVLSEDTTVGYGVVGTLGASRGGTPNPHLAQMFVKDSVSGEYLPVVQGLQYETEPLDFAGTLLSFRASLNLLSLVGETPLGKDAFKLYMETAVLGVKDYLGVYTSIRERVPVMVGLGLPTFNWLDLFAVEVEYYPNPHYPGFLNRMDADKLPLPGSKHMPTDKWHLPAQIDGAKEADDWLGSRDDLKWGFVVAKSIKGFGVAAQAGVDHTKMLDRSYLAYHNVLQSSDDWYFQIRFMGGI